ncbi:MAG TPA: winged helix DNA-binding protein [Mycobacteriales bacterium]|nr:winged helix DNA-binding protein [Mycobacteriales bacterium]
MDALELFVLGRKLMKLASRALPEGGLSSSVRSVLIDVAAHPDSSISQITERTGFPQSHVSTSVARLREMNAVRTSPDPLDGRRTLVRVTPETIRRVARSRTGPVDGLLAGVLGDDDPAVLAEVIDALEMLSRRLTPKARARIAAERAS